MAKGKFTVLPTVIHSLTRYSTTFIMPSNWAALVTELRALQKELIEIAQSLEKTQRERSGVCGTWSPKEVLAHLTGWDVEVTRQYRLFLDGLEKAIEHDIEEFNKKSVSQRSHQSWEETMVELRNAHKEFIEVAHSIPPSELTGNREYRGWMKVQIEHYQHHIQQLSQWV